MDVNAIDIAPMVPAASHCCHLPVVPLLSSMSPARNIKRFNSSQLWKYRGAAVAEGGWEDLDGLMALDSDEQVTTTTVSVEIGREQSRRGLTN
uniref:Uncharacterized protein n=1 Tax=Haemonchus contortus TaxID=6289 RepID=A0A7I4YF43_HAECO